MASGNSKKKTANRPNGMHGEKRERGNNAGKKQKKRVKFLLLSVKHFRVAQLHLFVERRKNMR